VKGVSRLYRKQFVPVALDKAGLVCSINSKVVPVAVQPKQNPFNPPAGMDAAAMSGSVSRQAATMKTQLN
jgi:hypothetical protein